jgi:hypothetical protein
LGFKSDRTAVGKTEVESGAVIKSFDVVEDSAASLGKAAKRARRALYQSFVELP